MSVSKYLQYILFFCLISGIAVAHDWYPVDCCSGKDCRPVACEELHEDREGGILYKNFRFVKSMVKPSQDMKCHVCIGGTMEKPIPRCAFVHQNT